MTLSHYYVLTIRYCILYPVACFEYNTLVSTRAGTICLDWRLSAEHAWSVRRFQPIVPLCSAGISDKYSLGEITQILYREKPACALTATRRRWNGSTWNRHPLTLTLATCVSATRMRFAWTITGTTRTVRTWGIYFVFRRQRAQPPRFEMDSTR
jgi:hypothetical protein